MKLQVILVLIFIYINMYFFILIGTLVSIAHDGVFSCVFCDFFFPIVSQCSYGEPKILRNFISEIL